jgi:hypothetical protein
MNDTAIGLDQAEEDILNYQLSDEAMERAGSIGSAYTIAMCSGLQSCPSAPA